MQTVGQIWRAGGVASGAQEGVTRKKKPKVGFDRNADISDFIALPDSVAGCARFI